MTGDRRQGTEIQWRKVFYLIPTLFLFLAGCATQQLKIAPDPLAAWQLHQAAMDKVHAWQMQGLLGVRLPKQAFSANYHWQQAGAVYTINLYGPLGIGATELNGNSSRVTLELHDGRLLTADNAQDLMQANLGWSLPVNGLIYWVRGIPLPNIPAEISLNQYGLAATLQQQGWNIQYLEYQIQDGWPYPRKMRLQNGNLSLTVVVNGWLKKN